MLIDDIQLTANHPPLSTITVKLFIYLSDLLRPPFTEALGMLGLCMLGDELRNGSADRISRKLRIASLDPAQLPLQ